MIIKVNRLNKDRKIFCCRAHTKQKSLKIFLRCPNAHYTTKIEVVVNLLSLVQTPCFCNCATTTVAKR